MRVEIMVPDLAFRYTRAFFALMLVGVLWICQNTIENFSFRNLLRTDAGKSLGMGGLALSSSSVGWLDRLNCGVCP